MAPNVDTTPTSVLTAAIQVMRDGLTAALRERHIEGSANSLRRCLASAQADDAPEPELSTMVRPTSPRFQ